MSSRCRSDRNIRCRVTRPGPIVAATLALWPVASLWADPLFVDTFDGEAYEFNTALDQWQVFKGTVDIVSCAGSGACVDLDGSTPGTLPTLMAPRESFAITAGRTYTIAFEIPTGSEPDPFTISLGAFHSRSFTDYAFPLSETLSFTAGTSGTATLEIRLGQPENNNYGPYLTAISLSETETQ